MLGKLPDNYPLYRGHTGPVLDTDFNPFNDYVIASGAEDSKVMIWNIPEEYAEEQEDITPVLKLSGHGRYVRKRNTGGFRFLDSLTRVITVKLDMFYSTP